MTVCKHCRWEDVEKEEKGETHPLKCLFWGRRLREENQIFWPCRKLRGQEALSELFSRSW